jgi:hypothetical protein
VEEMMDEDYERLQQNLTSLKEMARREGPA